jgi:nitroreductase
MDALEALNTRSSAKTFGDTTPSKEHLAIVLQAAVRAPDHGRLRPWRFMLVEGNQRRKLGELLAASALRRIPGLGEGDCTHSVTCRRGKPAKRRTTPK